MSRTREQIRAETKRLKAEYGALFDELLEICFIHDPIGINFEDNSDEYAPEVRTILPRLRTCKTSDDTLKVVYQEFQKWFNHGIAGTEDKYRPLAEDIWNAWNARVK